MSDALLNEISLEQIEEDIALDNDSKNAEDIRYLDAQNIKVQRTAGGFLSLNIEPDEHYGRINVYRTFPFSENTEFISVRTVDGKEIGVIKSLSELSEDNVKLIQDELSKRYFVPQIKTIIYMKEEFGYGYWNVETDAGLRKFIVRRGRNDLVFITDTRILVIDVDGNRYEIKDYRALDKRSYRLLERLL